MIYVEQLKERYRLVIKYLGTIIIGIGFALLFPLLVIPFYVEEIYQSIYFIISAGIALLIGISMRKSIKINSEETLSIQEGGVIIILSWIVAIFFAALPFWLSGILDFSQGIFEAVSGLTTTGLSMVDVTKTPKIFLMWRSIIQFFGGAGIAVVMLAAIIGPHGLALYNAEGRTDRLMPNVAKSTKLIMKIYSGYVFGGVVLYSMFGMTVFDAINHSMAAISTGGFSTQVDSIGAYNSIAIELITIVLMVLGTINFASHLLLLKGDIKNFVKIGEIKFMGFLIAFSIPIAAFLSLNNIYGSIPKGLRVASFEFISAISTTGFSTVGYNNWHNSIIFMMIILMIIGGGTGSTAGGIKIYRIYVMIKSLVWNIQGYVLPRRVVRENIINRPEGEYCVKKNHIIDISNFITVYLIFYVFGVFVLVGNGYSLQNSMFEMASSISTVGLSVGITSPNAAISVMWVQIIGMLLGRLEFLVVFFAGIKIIKDIKFIIKNRR